MRSITNLTLGAVLYFFAVATAATARRTEIRMADYGIVPGTGQDLTPALNRALGLDVRGALYFFTVRSPPSRRQRAAVAT